MTTLESLISTEEVLPSLEELEFWLPELPIPEKFHTSLVEVPFNEGLVEMGAKRFFSFDSFLWRRVREPNKFLRKVGDFKEDLTRELELATFRGKDSHPIINAFLSGFLVLDWDEENTDRIEELRSSAIIVITPSGKKKALFHVQIYGPKKAKDLEGYLKWILKKCNFECNFDKRLSAMTVFFLSKETFENPPKHIPKTFLIYKDVPAGALSPTLKEWRMPMSCSHLESLIESLDGLSPKQRREMTKVALFMLGNSKFLVGMDLPQDYIVKILRRAFPEEICHQPYVSEAIRLLRKYRLIQCTNRVSFRKAKTYRVTKELAEILRSLPKDGLTPPEKIKIESGRWHDELGKLVYRFQTRKDYLEYVGRIPNIQKKDRLSQAQSWSLKLPS